MSPPRELSRDRWLRVLAVAGLVSGLGCLGCLACGWMPGKPTPQERPVPPSKVEDFQTLYTEYCSGCHGAAGEASSAHPMDDPVYMAVASDAVLERVTAHGVPGSLMPAFVRSSGGTLTEAQIQTLVSGMRSRWARPARFRGVSLPPYSKADAVAAGEEPGDPGRGRAVFRTFCASCHGSDGTGGAKAGSVVDPAYLSLVSDQALRTAVIAGRPRLGMPDWRHDVSGKPLGDEQISDVVAWLASRRPKPGAEADRIAGQRRVPGE